MTVIECGWDSVPILAWLKWHFFVPISVAVCFHVLAIFHAVILLI